MSDVPAWGFYAIVALQLVAMLMLGHRCDTLSKRISVVHQRISKNSKINGLIDSWDDDVCTCSPLTNYTDSPHEPSCPLASDQRGTENG